MVLLLGPNGKLGLKNGKLAIKGPGGTDCCCGGAPCCGRILPQTLYLSIENIPVGPDPLPPFNMSSCCGDGVRIPLNLCQHIPATTDPLFQGGPNIWGGSGPWCDDGMLTAEWQCGLPGAGSNCEGVGDVLRIYIDDDCDDQFQAGAFVCDETPATTILRSLTSIDRLECACGDGVDTFFRYVYQTNALFGQCCNNQATVGPRLNWIITEL